MCLSSKTYVYLGPQGSYTEIAVDKFFEKLKISSKNNMVKNSIIKTIESLNIPNHSVIVPIENSIEGIVRETLDNLVKLEAKAYIVAETVIPISHCLISNNKNISEIKTIISHPQALAQCQKYISERFNNEINLVNSSSTAAAVKSLTESSNEVAAIGTEKAAKLYELNILDKSINDIADNKTRFVMLDDYIPSPTGNDKTSIAFSIKNETGCLADILNIFKNNNINLCYIESRPSKKVFGEYTFFVDLEGHVKDKNVSSALALIKNKINFYKLLGSYPKVI